MISKKLETKHNEEVADRYNQNGVFPKIVLIDKSLNVKNVFTYNEAMNTGMNSFIKAATMFVDLENDMDDVQRLVKALA